MYTKTREKQLVELYKNRPTENPLSRGAGTSKVIAIIPALNEELVIGTVVLKTSLHVDHVIVIDDGSTDQTGHVAQLAGAEVIRFHRNMGKAHAVMEGFMRAREIGCKAVVMLDGDGQHNPDEIPNVVSPVLHRQADLVIGSRAMNGNGIPAYRRFGQKTIDLATNMGNDFKCTDTQSGFRALSCNALKAIDFISDGYDIESDMIAHFSRKGLRITEVPIDVQYDVPHKHKKNPVTHGMGLLTHLIGLVGYKRPLLLFGLPGGIALVVGFAAGSLAFAEYYTSSKFPFALSMFSVLLLIAGLLLITSGIILNSIAQLIKMERGKGV